MPSNGEFAAIFEEFKIVLKKCERYCAVERDTSTDYYLNTRILDAKGKPIFFGATSINKQTVSFYLMPVYLFPDLLDNLSPELARHKHGKSCFRFKSVDPTLLKELTALTRAAWDRYKQQSLA